MQVKPPASPQERLAKLQDVLSEKWDRIERIEKELESAGDLFSSARADYLRAEMKAAKEEYEGLEVWEGELMREVETAKRGDS